MGAMQNLTVAGTPDYIKTKTGRTFTKINCVFPDGGTYRTTVFDVFACNVGDTIQGLVEEDQPYQGKRQFKIEKPIIMGAGAAGPVMPVMPPSPTAMPSAPPTSVPGYAPQCMSYEDYTNTMRMLLEDAFVLVEEVLLKRNIEVSPSVMMENARSIAISGMIAVMRKDLTKPEAIPF